MNLVITDELQSIDEAFSRNRLLATFPADARALVEPHAAIVALERNATVQQSGADVDHSLFLFGKTMVSLVIDIDGGRSIEVASIGNEGAVGGIVSCGHAPAFARAQVLIEGHALRIDERTRGRQAALVPHSQPVLPVFRLSAQPGDAVRRLQQLPFDRARAAGWLLTAQDRGGDRIELTQEALPRFLAFSGRASTPPPDSFRTRTITTRRGIIQVIDRAGLKRRACGCYRTGMHFVE